MEPIKLRTVFDEALVKFLKNMKRDLEAKGLIPTLDEAIKYMEEIAYK